MREWLLATTLLETHNTVTAIAVQRAFLLVEIAFEQEEDEEQDEREYNPRVGSPFQPRGSILAPIDEAGPEREGNDTTSLDDVDNEESSFSVGGLEFPDVGSGDDDSDMDLTVSVADNEFWCCSQTKT